jgi:hypothetical protein
VSKGLVVFHSDGLYGISMGHDMSLWCELKKKQTPFFGSFYHQKKKKKKKKNKKKKKK